MRIEESTERPRFPPIASLFKRMGKGKILLDKSLQPFYGQADKQISLGDQRGFRIGPFTERELNGQLTAHPSLTREEAVDRIDEEYVSTALHELIHQSAREGTYDDLEVASAVYEILRQQGEKPPGLPDPRNTGANSQYINMNYLYRFCPNPYKNNPVK